MPTTLSARQAAGLCLQRAKTFTADAEQTWDYLCQQPELTATMTLAQGLIELVRQRLSENWAGWLATAANRSVKAFRGC
ncbi:MAG: hypothetical protein AAGG53_17770 [Cyanobacteria bacterium P01_H01_bin.152]